jgi:hypothetical protein
MNYKKLASSALAAAAAAAVVAVAHAVSPSLPTYAQGLLASGVAAVVHWIDAWGSNPVVPASPADSAQV